VTGTNFTVKSVTNNTFGNTSELKVDNGTTVDFADQLQTVGGLNGQGEITNGQLTVNATAESTFAGTLTGSTSLTKTGNEKLTLSGNNIYTGETKINAGKLALTEDGSIENSSKVTVDGTFDISGIKASSTSVKDLSGNNTGKVNLGAKALSVTKGTFGGVIEGSGTLTKTGNETLTLTGNNTYEGATTINAGTLALKDSGSIADSSGVNVIGTFDVSGVTNKTSVQNLQGFGSVNLGNKELSVADGNFGGVVSGSGTLTKTGTNTLTLSGKNTATGIFAQTGGIVNLQNTWSGKYEQSANTTLNLTNNSKIGGNANFSGVVDITSGKLDVNGDIIFETGSVLKMIIAANKITADSLSINENTTIELYSIPDGRTENVIVSKTPLDPTQLDSHFTQTDKLLAFSQPFYSDDYKTMGFESYSKTAEQYTTENHFRNNQTQLAGLLDDYAPAQAVLSSLETRDQLEELIQPFLVTEIAADAQTLPLHHHYFHVFNHLANLSNNSNSNINGVTRGQSAYNPEREVWFEGYYQGGKTNGDSNALGYKTSNGGMIVGVDQYFCNRFLTGLVFSYGKPQVYNSVGKIEADDYMFGVYSRLTMWGIYANTFLGYGNQNYKLRQNFANPNTHYNGDSFYASLEFLRPFILHNDFSVSSLFAVDFQKAWSDGFNVNVIGLPLSVGKSDLDQTVLRFGLNSNYKNLRTRLQYGYQVAGDLQGISRTSVTGGNNNRVLTGVYLGRHTLNVGLGVDFKIGNRTKLFADYDFDLGKNSTAHSGQFGFVHYF
jgi:autotransporter-associated beta strand protein